MVNEEPLADCPTELEVNAFCKSIWKTNIYFDIPYQIEFVLSKKQNIIIIFVVKVIVVIIWQFL